MAFDFDPDLVREHGCEVYQDAAAAYAANARNLSQALDVSVGALARAADGLVSFIATLEIEHRQLDDIADQFDALTGETGLPRTGRTRNGGRGRSRLCVRSLPVRLLPAGRAAVTGVRAPRGDLLATRLARLSAPLVAARSVTAIR